MREFFLNVTRYPRYLVTFTLGVMNSVAEPLAQRRSNPCLLYTSDAADE